MMTEYNIKLTESQVSNLVEFFELNFIDSIRTDTDIDSMDYMVDMCEVYTKLKEALEENNG
jgi:hypothetical protein